MNLLDATNILELPEKYNPEMLKKNYREMAKKYHPDKNKDPIASEKFIKVTEAYNFLNQSKDPIFQSKEHIFDLNQLFKSFNQFTSFTPFTPFTQFTFVKQQEVLINVTPKEYLTGTTKSINGNCTCEKNLCNNCVGTGFNLKGGGKILNTCMDCLGNGFKNCDKCKIDIVLSPKLNITEFLHPMVGKIKIKIDDPYYLYNGKLYCKFDITLKESLTGFTKTFKDPFDEIFTILVKKIIKSNDGYKLENVTLVFNVIYPKKLSNDVIEQLKSITF